MKEKQDEKRRLCLSVRRGVTTSWSAAARPGVGAGGRRRADTVGVHSLPRNFAVRVGRCGERHRLKDRTG